jgi:3-oxoacyl-[acyl-carrier protein] reductase
LLGRLDRENHQRQDLAGDVVRSALGAGKFIDKGKARQRLERVVQTLVVETGTPKQDGDDLMSARIAAFVPRVIVVAQHRQRPQAPKHIAVHRVEMAKDGGENLETVGQTLGSEDVWDALQPAARRQVVVHRFEERIAISELRIDGHPRYSRPLGNRLERESSSADQLLNGCGDDASAALPHRRGAALQLVRTRRHVAAFTVQSLVMNPPATATTPDLRDEVVVVTGGSRGNGAGTARRFAALGARVVVSGRDRGALETVVGSITLSGGRAVGIPAECTNQGEVNALLAGTEAAFGPATMLLAFAGGDGRPEPIDQLDATRWRSVIDGNLTATYITVRTFALGMTERRRGSIVTMSSTAGRQPGGASVAYAAAKAGIVMLTRHLANDLAPHGVRINCIAPSAIETERLVSLMPAAAREQLGQSFPLRRLGTVDDVADAALYLATEQSAWVTGITIDVSGGRVTA